MAAPARPDGAFRLDPALPGLAAALSAHPPGTAVEDRCRVRSVDWAPRRRCRVVQEVRGPARTTLLAYEVTPAGTAVRGPADDPGLPGLGAALSPDRVRHRLAAVCRAPVGACRATPVAHRPGSRAVVAYDVEAGSGRDRLYAKLLADGPDRYAAAATALTGAARRRNAPAPVPEVLAVWSDLGAVVSRAAPGRALSDVLREETLAERAALRYAGLLGRLLAGVHGTPGGPLPRWTAEDELTALEPLLTPAWHADAATGRSLAALVDRLADAVPADGDPVLAHGAFRTGQVLADGGALTLLDLDTVAGSDPARDAGNALAYLEWAAVRGVLRPGLAAALQESFAAGYAECRAALADGPLAWWSAAAMAKIAGRRFRSLATAEWHRVPDLLRCAAARLGPAGGRGDGALPAPPAIDLLAEQLRARTPGAGQVRVLQARTLAEAPGRRRTVRYEVEGLDPDRVVPLIGKTYADRHRSATTGATLRLLGEVFAATPDLAVPAPVCVLPGLRTVLYREVGGTAVDRLPAGAAATAAGRAARWLATLHASTAVLPRRLDLAHEVEEAGSWARRVADGAPDFREAARALARRLAAAAVDLPAGPEVPVHKDFHAGHVLAGPGGITVIDLDEARMGDPVLDVAHFTSYLDAGTDLDAGADLDATRLDVRAEPRLAEVRAAFLDGYGPLPGPCPDARMAFFSAYTSLKIAKQLVTGRGPLAGRSFPPGAAVPAVLRRGLACLDG